MVELTFGLVTTAESNQQLCSKCNSISTCLLSFCADVTSALSLCITITPDLWQCLSCIYRGHTGSGWCPRGEEKNKQINTNTPELLHFPLMESAWKKIQKDQRRRETGHWMQQKSPSERHHSFFSVSSSETVHKVPVALTSRWWRVMLWVTSLHCLECTA